MKMGAIAARQLDEYRNRDNCIIIDLRSETEYNQYHVGGAINIPAEKIGDNPGVFNVDTIYVLYCERGGKSTSIARDLARYGYHAISVIGGIDAYKGKQLY